MIYQNTSSTLTAQMQTKPQQSGQSSYGVSGFLLWLKLWMASAAQGILTDMRRSKNAPRVTGYQRPRSLLPDEARSAMAPRVLVSRRSKRILARGLPASRRYFGYEHLNARQLTGNQFLERAAKLSVNGRMGVYRLEYRLRLCQRLPKNTKLSPKPRSTRFETLNTGLCAAHLYPN